VPLHAGYLCGNPEKRNPVSRSPKVKAKSKNYFTFAFFPLKTGLTRDEAITKVSTFFIETLVFA
jgi:hypothetical protein